VLGPLRPDVVLVQDAPWRLRWRTPAAELARALGLFFAAGGRDAAGNLVLVGLRVRVSDAGGLCYPGPVAGRTRGAVLARCEVAGTSFVVAGTQLAAQPGERAAQAAVLADLLTERGDRVLVAGGLDVRRDGQAWRLLAQGRRAADEVGGDAGGTGVAQPLPRHGSILVGPALRVCSYQVGAAGVVGFAPVAVDLEIAG
jgi:endonuclease/exonuclease/phosphatase family metal-dependent hydrolase